MTARGAESGAAAMPKLIAPDSTCGPHIYQLYTRLNHDEKVSQGAKKAGVAECRRNLCV